MDKLYPEIHRPIGEEPTFPDDCPICKAAMTIEFIGSHGVAYSCGGAYKRKPQIENHTDRWWGECRAK